MQSVNEQLDYTPLRTKHNLHIFLLNVKFELLLLQYS